MPLEAFRQMNTAEMYSLASWLSMYIRNPKILGDVEIIFARIKLILYRSLIIEGPVADLNPCRRDKRSILDHLSRHRISLPEVKLVVLANRDCSKACPACMR